MPRRVAVEVAPAVRRADFGLGRVTDVRPAAGWTVFVAFWIVQVIVAIYITGYRRAGPISRTFSTTRREDSLAVLIVYVVLICLSSRRSSRSCSSAGSCSPCSGAGWADLGRAAGRTASLRARSRGRRADADRGRARRVRSRVVPALLAHRLHVPGMALHALNNSITFGAVKEPRSRRFAGVVAPQRRGGHRRCDRLSSRTGWPHEAAGLALLVSAALRPPPPPRPAAPRRPRAPPAPPCRRRRSCRLDARTRSTTARPRSPAARSRRGS